MTPPYILTTASARVTITSTTVPTHMSTPTPHNLNFHIPQLQRRHIRRTSVSHLTPTLTRRRDIRTAQVSTVINIRFTNRHSQPQLNGTRHHMPIRRKRINKRQRRTLPHLTAHSRHQHQRRILLRRISRTITTIQTYQRHIITLNQNSTAY